MPTIEHLLQAKTLNRIQDIAVNSGSDKEFVKEFKEESKGGSHFKLTTESIEHKGVKLFRVQYKDGTKGGFVEKKENLAGKAKVLGNAKVFGNAVVSDDAQVSGDTVVSGSALVRGDAVVSGDDKLFND